MEERRGDGIGSKKRERGRLENASFGKPEREVLRAWRCTGVRYLRLGGNDAFGGRAERLTKSMLLKQWRGCKCGSGCVGKKVEDEGRRRKEDEAYLLYRDVYRKSDRLHGTSAWEGDLQVDRHGDGLLFLRLV